jgi:hypothetical protein
LKASSDAIQNADVIEINLYGVDQEAAADPNTQFAPLTAETELSNLLNNPDFANANVH